MPFEVQLVLPTGQQINAHYNKNSQSITHLGELIQECKKTSGSFVLFSYNGRGKYLVNIFNYHGSEVEYIIPKHHDLDYFCHQGNSIVPKSIAYTNMLV